jgi:hypothetical protein
VSGFGAVPVHVNPIPLLAAISHTRHVCDQEKMQRGEAEHFCRGFLFFGSGS